MEARGARRDRRTRERERERMTRGYRKRRERPKRERGRGVITLATLTRRRPDNRSRSTRSTRSTRLRLTYTPTLGLPLHLLLPHRPSLLTSSPTILSPTSYFSFFSSSSFLLLGPRLFLLLCLAVRVMVHPSSLLDRRTRKHQHQRNRTSYPPRESPKSRREQADRIERHTLSLMSPSPPSPLPPRVCWQIGRAHV